MFWTAPWRWLLLLPWPTSWDEAAVACGSIEGYWRCSVLQDSVWCYGDQLQHGNQTKGWTRAQLEIASSIFLVSDFSDDSAAAKNMGIGCVLCLEIDDVEAALAKAVSAGIVDEGKLAKGNSACCCGRLGAWKRSRIHVVSHGSFALRSRRTLTWKLESGLIWSLDCDLRSHIT